MTEKDWNAGRLLETSGQYWKTCALHAGVKLGVFSLLAKGPATAAETAARIPAESESLERLLNALSAMGLLEKDGDRFSDTEAAARFLDRESDAYIGHMILHHHHLVRSWSQLDQAVITGRPVRARAVWTKARSARAF